MSEYKIKRNSSLFRMANRYGFVDKKLWYGRSDIDLCSYSRSIMKSALMTIFITAVFCCVVMAVVDLSLQFGWKWWEIIASGGNDMPIVEAISGYNAWILAPVALIMFVVKIMIFFVPAVMLIAFCCLIIHRTWVILYAKYIEKYPTKKSSYLKEYVKAKKDQICPTFDVVEK